MNPNPKSKIPDTRHPTPDTLLLAMETSGDVCGVAIFREGECLSEHTFRHGMHLSERLMEHLDAVLREAGVALKEVAAFAVGIGPGSFTGTRIGVMTIKTLAAVLEQPVYSVGGLEAMAAVYSGLHAVVVAPILPCRSGIVFTAAYSVAGAAPEPLIEPAALSIDELAARLRELDSSQLLFCGAAVERYRSALYEALAADRQISFGTAQYPNVVDIGSLAWRRIVTGSPSDDPFSLVPYYISPPPITLPRKGKTIPGGEAESSPILGKLT